MQRRDQGAQYSGMARMEECNPLNEERCCCTNQEVLGVEHSLDWSGVKLGNGKFWQPCVTGLRFGLDESGL